jgi:hypothetical protein
MKFPIGGTITSRKPSDPDPDPESELRPLVPLDLLAAYNMIAMPIAITINPRIPVLSFKINPNPIRKMIIPMVQQIIAMKSIFYYLEILENSI